MSFSINSSTPLSANDLVRLWEVGHNKPGWYQALLILAAAFPKRTQGELAELPIGLRNGFLFALREQLLGSKIDACVKCPECRETLEFSLQTRDIYPPDVPDFPATVASNHVFRSAPYLFTLRLPTSRDLQAVAELPAEFHPIQIAQRCIQTARHEESRVDVNAIPHEMLAAVAGHLTELDPFSEIRLSMDCDACRHHWSSRFDIVNFMWVELSTQVKRLVNEVSLLARHFGWRESEILQMSATLRQQYIETVQ